MTGDNKKQILISIIVGACVAFFTALFDGLSEFLKTHSTEIISGAVSSAVYIAKSFRG